MFDLRLVYIYYKLIHINPLSDLVKASVSLLFLPQFFLSLFKIALSIVHSNSVIQVVGPTEKLFEVQCSIMILLATHVRNCFIFCYNYGSTYLSLLEYLGI